MDAKDKSKDRYILLVAGGVGSRLWPLSRECFPKQFHQIFDNSKSLFQLMEGRCSRLVGSEKVITVCNQDFSEHVREQLPLVSNDRIIIEPERKDNFPAIVLGISDIYRRNPDAQVAVVWSDHYIFDEDLFENALINAFSRVERNPEELVSVGTKPYYPEIGFGYIKITRKGLGDVYGVKKFLEKPKYSKAKKFVKSGRYLWNTGYKVMKARNFLEEVESLYSVDTTDIDKIFSTMPSGSIEDLYTVHKKEQSVVKTEMRWSDVGNWRSLLELQNPSKEKDFVCENANVTYVDALGTLTHGATKHIAVVGVQDIYVVETPDALLIVHRDSVHKVKDLRGLLKLKNPELL